MVREFDGEQVEGVEIETFGIQAVLLGALKYEFDEWLLVILDACRYDALASMLHGEMIAALSPATNTGTWIRGIWPGQYDVTYIAGNPHLSEPKQYPAMDGFGGLYRGEEHFERVVESFRVGWDGHHGTVPPAAVRDDAIEHTDADKVVAHFMQPHTPYIGERQPDREFKAWANIQDEKAWLQGIDGEEIAGWYLDNLERAWTEGVEPLLKAFDDRLIVITADHGEALGEGGIYGHGSTRLEVLLVPWITIEPGGWEHAGQ